MKTGQWMYQIGESDIWNSGEEFDTKEEAIKAGREEVIAENKSYDDKKYQYEHFYIGLIEECSNCHGVNVERILEDIAEIVYDEVGEVAEDYLADVTREHSNELEEKLNDVLFTWMKEHGYTQSFFKIVAVETVEI